MIASHPATAKQIGSKASAEGGGLRWAIVEVVWLFLIFFLAAASPPPDAGESHYWVKARHYWEPAWCVGDLFLESRDAHLTFDWTFGWLTKVASLSVAVWIARLVAWAMLAWAWRRLSWAIVPVPLMSLVSAGLMLLLAKHFHLARELVLRGGVEAKTVAYVFVFLALEAAARSRWRAALLLAGTAGAFHVLVGGWTALAIGFAFLVTMATEKERPSLLSLLPAAVGGLILTLPGLVPAILLNQGVDAATAREAARIYVFERLPHHLVFHAFEPWFIGRFGLLVAVWGGMVSWIMYTNPKRERGMTESLACASGWYESQRLLRVQMIVAGSVLLCLIGIAVDQGLAISARLEGLTFEEYQLRAASLLRYYWFRLADVLVPVGVALGLVFGVHRLQATRPQLAGWLLVAAIVAAGSDLAATCYQRAQRRLPGAVVQQHERDTQHLEHWQAACHWIAANTPPEAKFLTPRQQQTFKWYAGRAEVATWKDIPQDARGIARWWSALNDVHPNNPAHRQHDLAAFSDEELVALAHQYGATYILIDRSRAARPILLPKVYPQRGEENPAFAVYRVPAKIEP